MNLPRLSDEFYRSARRLRVFTADRTAIPTERVLAVLRQDAGEVAEKLDRGKQLLH
jgi:hypothetical protein